jgi:hypothetical protein
VSETLSPRRLNRATLARQMLLEREKLGVAEAVERLGALQAQEPKPPFVGLWSRLDGFRREDLVKALHDRSVVRATLFRATLHIVSAGDFAALRATLPLLDGALRTLGQRAEGLDTEKVLAAARKLLARGPLTFNEVRARLQEQFPEANDRALGYATRTGLPLVTVPSEDRWGFPRDTPFALADKWIDAKVATKPAPEALVRRYLGAFGPATAADVQTWTGVGGMKAVLAGMEDELAVFPVGRGRKLYDLPDAPRPEEDVPAPPRFLPEFDSLVLAHDDRSRLIPAEHKAKLITKNLRVRAAFLWDGMAAGTWTVEGKKVKLEPFEKLPRGAAQALAEEGEALIEFVEG